MGRSPKDRHGAGWHAIRKLFPESWRDRIRTGLPDAENVFRQVRDLGGADTVPADECAPYGYPPPSDKRLLLEESEFGSLLQQLGRPGNAWAPLLHQAWKCSNLAIPAGKGRSRSGSSKGLRCM